MASIGEATGKVASALPRSLAGSDSFRGIYMLALATGVGIISGLTTTAMGALVRAMHIWLFRLPDNDLLDLLLARRDPDGELDTPEVNEVLALMRRPAAKVL